MSIDYNLISLVDILGLTQGIILGTLLLAINRKRDKSTLFLGLFIIIYALELLPVILDDLGILDQYPEYILLPFDFTWLTFPLFYIYVQQVSIFSQSKKSYNVLIPGILAFCVGIFIFFQSVEVKKEIEESLWYNLALLLGLFYSLGVGVLTLKWIKNHIVELKNQYSAVDFKVLHWARIFVFIGLFFTITIGIVSVFTDNDHYYFDLTISIINVVLLYWVSMRGILQRNVTMLVSSSEKNTATEKKTHSSENSQLLLKKINDYIVNNNIFTKPDLTILDISEGVNAHPKKISGVINSNLNQNFNTYINSFRIEKAKTLLKSGTANNLSIEGIGNEVGFQSKSTFYDAFKKVTGTTPSRYKNQP